VILNNLASADLIAVGQVLRLPGGAAQTAQPEAVATAIPPSSPTVSNAPTATSSGPSPYPSSYKVQADDENLFHVAEKFGIPTDKQDAWVNAVEALNHLDATGLYPGNTIQFPPAGQY
jgi:LysM repeat protein